MDNKTKRKLAKELYVRIGLSQKEIAERFEVSEQTICAWKEKDEWEMLRVATMTGPEQIIKRLYDQIGKIIQKAEDENRELDEKEADKISKISAAIGKAEQKATLGHVVEIMEEFANFLREIDIEVAKTIVVHQSNFVQKKAKDYSE